MKTAYWLTISYIILLIIVCMGVYDTLAEPQQFVSIGIFLIGSFIVLALSSLGGTTKSLALGGGISGLLLVLMASVSIDIPNVTLRTHSAIVMLIVSTYYRAIIIYRIATKRRSEYPILKKRPDNYEGKRFGKKH